MFYKGDLFKGKEGRLHVLHGLYKEKSFCVTLGHYIDCKDLVILTGDEKLLYQDFDLYPSGKITKSSVNKKI